MLSSAYSKCIGKGDWHALPTVLPESPADGEVSLALTGDVMFSRGVGKAVRSLGKGDFAFPFAFTKSYIEEADIAFANLETPVSERGEKINKKHVFRSHPDSLKGLLDAGFDVVSVANNHILDFGEVAAEDTVRLLAEAGIRSGGLVRGQASQEPVIVNVRGVRVGFLFYCDPQETFACAREFAEFSLRPAEATPEVLKRDIMALDSDVDVLVVSLHWGIEHKAEPHEHMERLGRFVIDLGADLVAGHHPHMQHRAERYKEGLILYSMGNFVFDQWSRPGSRSGRIYRVIVGKDGVKQVVFVPLEILLKRWQPVPLSRGFVELEHDTRKHRLDLPECPETRSKP